MKFSVLMHDRNGNNTDPDEQPRKAEYPLTLENVRWIDSPYLAVEGSCRKCKMSPHKVFGDRAKTIGTLAACVREGEPFFALAICYDCKQPVGTIKVENDSLFGSEEDHRVLYGRPRVY